MTRRLSALAACSALFLLTACPSPRAVCGNGVKETGEACDDGNATNGDGCDLGCTVSTTDGGPGGGGGSAGGGAGGGGGMGGGGGGGPVCGNKVIDVLADGGMEACDDGNMTPNDGCENDCTVTPQTCGNKMREGTEQCDDGNMTPGDGCENDCRNTATPEMTCPNVPAAPDGGSCIITPGDGNKLITAVVLAHDKTYIGGQVLVTSTGTIACVGCDCSTTAGAATATKLVCPNAVLSPGLINAHDHLDYGTRPNVAANPNERYEHRHDWRVGGLAHDGHTKVNNQSGVTAANQRWDELRQVMSGTTAIVGATFNNTGMLGMLRNLDTGTAGQEGLGEGTINSETFPLNDQSGSEQTSGCGSPYTVDLPSVIPASSAYLPHVSEGIEASAYNEFKCISTTAITGAQDLLTARTGIVHGIGVKAADIGLMSQKRTALVWSPRSNVSLYGNTASIPTYSRMGVTVALGNDWIISGSMNMLRELKCAAGLNDNYFNKSLSDEQLWRMATESSADVTQVFEKIGRIQVGKVADLAMYRRQGTKTHRSVIDAEPADVVMTMRGGKVLYGDLPLVNAFDAAMMCDSLDVCGTMKGVCTRTEFTTNASATVPARSLAELQAANATSYPLFFCNGAPMNEPSCIPTRPPGNEKSMSTTYTMMGANDPDGDGIPTAMDNCPAIFNPARPMDNGKQADQDNDGKGDPCDECPLNVGPTCTMFNPNDQDGDGVLNAVDNCPADANMAQTDTDGDGKGDACDACAAPNPGNQACPATIYKAKNPAAGLLGQAISLGNVLVTAVHSTGFFLQVHESETGYTSRDYSAIFVYKPGSGLSAGDRINVTSAVPTDYFGQLELAQVVLPTGADGGTGTVSNGNPLPAATVVANPNDIATNGTAARTLEAVLVQVNNVTVTHASPDAGQADNPPTYEFEVNGALRINDLFYRPPVAPVAGQQFTSITGLLNFRNGNNKIEPRSAADLVAGAPLLAAIEPAQTFIREDAGTTLPAPLSVRLTNVWTSDVAVDVQSTSPANLVVGDGGLVIVPMGSLTAPIPLFGVLQGDAGVTGTLGTSMKSAAVRVLGASELSSLVALTPPTSGVAPGGKVTMKVQLDVPPTMDTVVALSVMPAAFGTTPAMVTVVAGQVEATFDFTADAAATGMGTVTATLGASMKTSTLTVQAVSTNHLVISEVAVRGQVDGGTAVANGDEFVELYNPTAQAVDVSGWKLQYKSAAGANYQDKVVLPVGTSIAARGYFLIASKSYQGSVVPDFIMTVDMGLAGDSGHVRLGTQDVSTAKVDLVETVDVLGYGPSADSAEGGSKTAATTAFLQTFERKATPGSTAASMAPGGGDELKGNGLDTEMNGADFVIRAVRDPQNSTSPLEP